MNDSGTIMAGVIIGIFAIVFFFTNYMTFFTSAEQKKEASWHDIDSFYTIIYDVLLVCLFFIIKWYKYG
jgi:succinate dehydrogenase/fumarate reductase cytochrome b subunit